jgi:hypothetical protein
MVNEDTPFVGQTPGQIIRAILSEYGLPETHPGMGEYTFPAMSATGTLIAEDMARFFDMMIQSEWDYPYGVPDYQWIQDMRNERPEMTP